jgi:hypothetical protein
VELVEGVKLVINLKVGPGEITACTNAIGAVTK